jgi:hypothetical protein
VVRTADGFGLVLNSSRGIIYASNGEDFVDAARAATKALRDEINLHRGWAARPGHGESRPIPGPARPCVS